MERRSFIRNLALALSAGGVATQAAAIPEAGTTIVSGFEMTSTEATAYNLGRSDALREILEFVEAMDGA